MGTWSRPLFCNFPKGKINLSKIDPKHYIFHYIQHRNGDITLEQLMDMFHEHSKIWGHLSASAMKAFEDLFEQIVLQNSSSCPAEIELHFYCIDDCMPYYLGYNVEMKKAYYALHYPYHVAFFKYNEEINEEEEESDTEFVDDLYLRRHKNVLKYKMVYFENEMRSSWPWRF